MLAGPGVFPYELGRHLAVNVNGHLHAGLLRRGHGHVDANRAEVVRYIIDRNDTPGRTQEEVLGLLDEVLGPQHTPTTSEK